MENYAVWAPELSWPDAVAMIGIPVVLCWLLLWVLLALQLYWETHLFIAIKKVLFEGNLQDTRSDTESGADTDDERAATTGGKRKKA